MKSKMVETRHKLANKVVSSARRYADDVALCLNRRYALHCGTDEPEPDWSAIQTFAGHRVDRLRVDLVSADSRQTAAENRTRRLRQQRNGSSRRLHRKLTAIRTVFDSAYGDGSCECTLGLVRGMSRKPSAVFRFGERALQRMRDPELELPPPAMFVGHLDLQRMMGDVEDDVYTLGRALEQLQECRRRLRRATEIKRSAMRRFDREIQPWTRLLQALYELCAEEALAADLKPAPKTALRRGSRLV